MKRFALDIEILGRNAGDLLVFGVGGGHARGESMDGVVTSGSVDAGQSVGFGDAGAEALENPRDC